MEAKGVINDQLMQKSWLGPGKTDFPVKGHHEGSTNGGTKSVSTFT